MIDTDKYEGHSRGNWSWGNKGSTDNGDGTIMIRPFTQLESKSGATLLAIHHGDAKQSDLKLIADAPLLLAEVKRLRKELDEVYQERDKYDGALNIALEHLGYQGADHEWFCREKYQCDVYGDDLEEEE